MLWLIVKAWLTHDRDEVLSQWLHEQTTEWTSGFRSWRSRSARQPSSAAYVSVSVPVNVCQCFHPPSVTFCLTSPETICQLHDQDTDMDTLKDKHTHLARIHPFHFPSSSFSFLHPQSLSLCVLSHSCLTNYWSVDDTLSLFVYG